MYTKIIIEDLGSYTSDNKDARTQLAGKLLIEAEHKLSVRIPRDSFVWTKNISTRNMLNNCKNRYKSEMLKLYPYFTNKKMIVNSRAILWS